MANRFSSITRGSSSSPDLNDPATRALVLQQLGIDEPKPPTSLLERIGSFFSAFETGNAAYTLVDTKNPFKAAEAYAGDILQGLGGALTGDTNKEKKTYADVLKKLGLGRGVTRDVLGFAGDVLLDPTTFITSGAGAGKKILGKTLTVPGAKAFNFATDRATVEIAEKMSGKAIKDLPTAKAFLRDIGPRKEMAEQFGQVMEQFAKDKGIVLKAGTGPQHYQQILDQHGMNWLERVSKTAPGTRLTEEIAGEVGEELAFNAFGKNALRFGGKELFELGGAGTKIGQAFVDPIQLSANLIASQPRIQRQLAKTKGFLANAARNIGNMFDTTYPARQAGLGNFIDNDIRLYANAMEEVQRETGRDLPQIQKMFEDLIDAGDDPTLFQEVLEGTPPSILRSLDKYTVKTKSVSDLAENSFARTLVNIDSSQQDLVFDFVKAHDVGDMKTADKLISQMRDGKMKDTLLANRKRFVTKDGKYYKIAGSIQLNKQNGLAQLVSEAQIGGGKGRLSGLIEPASVKQQFLKDRGFRNVDDFITRRFVGKNVDGKITKFDDAGLPVVESQAKVSDNLLGQERKNLLLVQGRTEGELATATDVVLAGRKFDVLSRAEKSNAAKEVVALMGESEVRYQQLKMYAALAEDVRDKTLFETGGNVSFKVSDINTVKTKAGRFKKVSKLAEGVDPKEVEKLKGEGWRTVKGTGNILDGHIVHPLVADVLENTHKAFFTDEGTQSLLKGYDKVMSFWKSSVTTFFPSFHVRNGLGNIMSNWIAGINRPASYEKARKMQHYINKLTDPKMSDKAMIKAGSEEVAAGLSRFDVTTLARKFNVIGADTFYDEIADKGAKGLPGLMRAAVDGGDITKWQRIKRTPRSIGNFVEDNAKLAHFIEKLEKGFSADEAARSVRMTLFDYSELTDFERNVMRRFVPFYTWTRKNSEMMMRRMVSNPGKFSTMTKGFRDVQKAFTEMDNDDFDKLPAWAKQGYSIMSGSGTDANVTTGFGSPLEAFAETAGSFLGTEERSPLNLLGPIPRGVVETATGVSLFTGRPIKDDTNGKKFRGLPNFMKDAIGYREIERTNKKGEDYIEYIVDPDSKAILNLFVGRFGSFGGKATDFSEALRGGENASPQLLNLISGIRTHQFNLTEEEEKREKESARALLTELEKLGLATNFNVQGLTKEAKEELNL